MWSQKTRYPKKQAICIDQEWLLRWFWRPRGCGRRRPTRGPTSTPTKTSCWRRSASCPSQTFRSRWSRRVPVVQWADWRWRWLEWKCGWARLEPGCWRSHLGIGRTCRCSSWRQWWQTCSWSRRQVWNSFLIRTRSIRFESSPQIESFLFWVFRLISCLWRLFCKQFSTMFRER